MTFKDYFSKLAASYASHRPSYPAGLFDYLVDVAPTRQSAWDCACGSGQATLALADRFEHVWATDASSAQLVAAPPHARVSYRVATAERSGLDDASIDLVTVAQALHWFDIERFYAEAKRVLKPGGVIAAWTYGVAVIEDEAVDRLAADFYRGLDPWWPPERALVESGYRTLPFPFEELTSPPFALHAQWTLPRLLGYFRSWSAVGLYMQEHGEDPVERLEASLAPVWGDPEEPRSVTWPLAIRAGRHWR